MACDPTALESTSVTKLENMMQEYSSLPSFLHSSMHLSTSAFTIAGIDCTGQQVTLILIESKQENSAADSQICRVGASPVIKVNQFT
jgi:hypothetical protein